MKKTFMCSLCHRGLLGSRLYLDRQAVTFVCQKLTIDKRFRKLVLPLHEIREVSWTQIIFPIAAFHMDHGETYRILIFEKRRFEKWFREFRANP